MITQQKAQQIAREWIEAWNRHDLDAIISHYTDDIEFTSPFVLKLLDNLSGTIKGKESLRSYFGKALAAYPDLKFDLTKVLKGVNSVTVYYRSVTGMMAAEVMMLNSNGEITKVMAHYD
jgi:ketosteroid isomerase-like protein